MKTKAVLKFIPELIDKPIVFRLVRDYGLVFNIIKADIDREDGGYMMVEIEGPEEACSAGMKYLASSGVKVEKGCESVALDSDRCTSCGYCVSFCPTRALETATTSGQISLDDNKCVNCGVCVKICPVSALEVRV